MAKSEKFKLSFGISIMLIFLGLVFILSNQLPALAAPWQSVQGWGWSETVGWISANCDNAGIAPPCDQTNYGVNANLITGEITGYAWSQLGWISFEPADLVGCPAAPCEARVDWVAPYNVTGWAKVLSYDGWISLDCSNTGVCGTSNYSVTYNDTTDEFEGWAYESQFAGWISFNCNNPESGNTCGSSDYQVFKKPSVGIPPIADFQFCREANGNISFFDLSSDSDGFITQYYWDFDDGTFDENQYPPPHSFPVPGNTYNVSLTIVDDGFNVVNNIQALTPATAPSCEFYLNTVSATACDLVSMEWDEAMGADEYEIYRRAVAIEPGFTLKETIDAQDYFVYCLDLIPGALETCSWTDNTTLPDRDYEYYIRALRFNGVSLNNSTIAPACSGSDIQICPMLETTPDCVATNFVVASACSQNDFTWDTVASAIGHNVFYSLNGVLPSTNIVASTFPATYCGGSCFNLGLATSYVDNEVLSDVRYYYSVEVIVDDGFGAHIVGPQDENASGVPRCYRGPVYIEQ